MGHKAHHTQFEHLEQVFRQEWATDLASWDHSPAAHARGVLLVAPPAAQADINGIEDALLARGYATACLVPDGSDATKAILQSQRVCVIVLHIDALALINTQELMQLRRQFPAVHWVLAWHSRSPRWIDLVVSLQAKGCIDCDDPGTFGRAIDSVVAGDLWFPRWLTQALYATLLASVQAARLDITKTLISAGGPLTHREAETLELLREGLSNKQIALRLGVGVNTVKKHVKSIFDKRGLHDRRQAAIGALLAPQLLFDDWVAWLLPLAAELL